MCSELLSGLELNVNEGQWTIIQAMLAMGILGIERPGVGGAWIRNAIAGQRSAYFPAGVFAREPHLLLLFQCALELLLGLGLKVDEG